MNKKNKMRKTRLDTNVNLTSEQKKLKLTLEKSIQIKESLANDFNDAIKQLPVVQYNHFEDMRRDIDIRRETLIQELYELSHKFNVEPVIERLQKQSSRMIKEIDEIDKEFRDKSKQLRLKPIEYNANDERAYLNELFNDSSNLTVKAIAILKYENEVKQDELKKHIEYLNLIERSLNNNKLYYNKNDEEDENRFKTLGELEVCTQMPNEFSFRYIKIAINENQSLITTSMHHSKIFAWNIQTPHFLIKRYCKTAKISNLNE